VLIELYNATFIYIGYIENSWSAVISGWCRRYHGYYEDIGGETPDNVCLFVSVFRDHLLVAHRFCSPREHEKLIRTEPTWYSDVVPK